VNVVYIYKLSENTSELRYSLRSVEKYLKPDNIFIIGDIPDWCQNVIHVPAKDKTSTKGLNTTYKIFKTLEVPEIKDSFILFCDDIYLLEDFHWKAFTNGTLSTILEKRKLHNKHWKALQNVHKVYPNGLNFDVHHPYFFEKEKLAILKNKFNFATNYCFSSLYYNTFIKDYEILKVTDWKIKSLTRFKEMLQIQPALFSTTNSLLTNPEIVKKMNVLYPIKSKYEK